jgi:hypothetical protein
VLGTVDIQEIEDKALEVMRDNSSTCHYSDDSVGFSGFDSCLLLYA